MSPLASREIAGHKVGPIGYGTMHLTVRPDPIPDAQAFETMKLAIDSGATFFNTADFYGPPSNGLAGLELLARFFEAEPTYKDRIFLSVKGALLPNFQPDTSDEFLRTSVERINATLKHRKMDLFCPARVDQSRSIEDTLAAIVKLRDEGHFKYIGLSEVSSTTIRKAVAVVPIAAVEEEVSPWALHVESNGVLATCKELKIPIVAYSPLGRGFLTGSLKQHSDIPKGDIRHMLDRFSPDNFSKNITLVDKLTAIAKAKGVTPSQLAISWILKQWDGYIPIPGSSRKEGVRESLAATEVELTSEEDAEIRKVVESAEVVGRRYNEHGDKNLSV